MNNFYNENTKTVSTEKLLQYQGLDTKNIELMNQLGYYEIDYQYIEYDRFIEKMLPEDELIKDGNKYIQKFRKEELSEEELNYAIYDCANSIREQIFLKTEQIASPYSDMFTQINLDTWNDQVDEMVKYLTDNSTSTPTLDEEYKDLPREEMLETKKNDILKYLELSLKVIGIRQRFDKIFTSLIQDESKSLKERILEMQKIDLSVIK